MTISFRTMTVATVLMACGGAATPAVSPASGGLDASLAGPQRTEAERARDVYRHPRETLSFFGLTDSMTVVELAPGQGWYTAVLAPVVREHGKLFVTTATADAPPEAQQNAKSLLDRLTKTPAVFDRVTTIAPDIKKDYSLGPDGSADMVLTFRNLHGWIRDGVLDKVFASAFRVLKSHGVLGVVEHRAPAGASTDPQAIAKTGYVPESMAIEFAQKAGFTMEEKSDINANPKDTKDYAAGVWALPPTYQGGDVDRAKFQAIGESDRMTIRFRKP
jgi:predicted methyltransferase